MDNAIAAIQRERQILEAELAQLEEDYVEVKRKSEQASSKSMTKYYAIEDTKMKIIALKKAMDILEGK